MCQVYLSINGPDTLIKSFLGTNKPEVAFDHLHTYCVKNITHLLSVRGIECNEDEPLHSRFGKYRKALIAERDLHEFTDRTLKVGISLFESYNDLENVSGPFIDKYT